MEKIWILGPNGTYEEASVLEEAIKENRKVKKKNECNTRKRRNGDLQEDKGEAGELASNDLHRGGEDPVV